MKNLILSILLVSFSINSLQAADRESIHAKLESLTKYFVEKDIKTENGKTYWEGQQELHPMWDLLFYVALSKVGKGAHYVTPKLREDTLKRVFDPKWRDASGAWKATPNGKADFNVTATILVTLKREAGLALPASDPRNEIKKAGWDWLKATHNFGQNDKDVLKINVLFRIFLAVTDVIPRLMAPPFPVNLLGLPKGAPMSPVDLGVFRTVMIPLTVWDFYHGPLPIVTRIDGARLNSKGSEFGKMNNRFLKNLNDDVEWDGFTTAVLNLTDLTHHNYWAQEGLGYLLSRKQEGNTWYVLGSSLVTLMAIDAALKSNIVNPLDPQKPGTPIDKDFPGLLQKAVDNAAFGLLSWRKIGSDEVTFADGQKESIHFIPAARSPIWDSSLALQNMSSLPEDISGLYTSVVSSVTNWMAGTSTQHSGDWQFWKAPETQLAPKSFAAWGFYPEAIWHPDTDDSASVMESLLKANPDAPLTKQGLDWILSQQNSDGGFPAWEKDTSKKSNKILLTIPGFPRVADFSQPDVSSRIMRMLLNAKKVESLNSERLEKAIKSNCEYLKTSYDQKAAANAPEGTPKLWEGDWIVDYTYGTAEVTASLMEAGADDKSCWTLEQTNPYMDWFKKVQNADGGWGESEQSYTVRSYVPAASSVLQTTYVMKSFLTYERLYREELKARGEDVVPSPYYPVIEKGIDYLMSKINSDGSVKEKSFTGVYIKGVIFSDYTLMPEYHTIGVLGEALKLLE